MIWHDRIPERKGWAAVAVDGFIRQMLYEFQPYNVCRQCFLVYTGFRTLKQVFEDLQQLLPYEPEDFQCSKINTIESLSTIEFKDGYRFPAYLLTLLKAKENLLYVQKPWEKLPYLIEKELVGIPHSYHSEGLQPRQTPKGIQPGH
ncbi:hypothetical protein FQR65_LT19813 [Abscondita terminalis]|nr:hypothetical protein FQR65_LT19813 [Abscondita terminalis]